MHSLFLSLSLSPSLLLSLSLSPSPLSLSPSLYTVYMYTLHCSLFRMCGHKLKCLLPCFKTKLFMNKLLSRQHSTRLYIYSCIYTCRVSWVRVPPKAAHFLRKSDCLGCTVLLCLAVCLTLLAYFFFLSLKHVTIKVMQCIYTYMCIACNDLSPPSLHHSPPPSVPPYHMVRDEKSLRLILDLMSLSNSSGSGDKVTAWHSVAMTTAFQLEKSAYRQKISFAVKFFFWES